MICAAVASLAFTAKALVRDEYGIVGEWVTSSTKPGLMTHVKFFPGGLMNIEKGSQTMIAHYKVIRCALANPVELKGRIVTTTNDKFPFEARISDRKVMHLTIDDPDSIKTYDLLKISDIRSGVIPVN